MRVSRHVSAASVVFLVLTELVCILMTPLIREVCAETCEEIYSVERLSRDSGGDKFTNLKVPCKPSTGCHSDGNHCTSGLNAYDGDVSEDGQCRCQCQGEHRTFNFGKCVNLQEFKSSSRSACSVRLENLSQQVPIRELPDHGAAGYIKPKPRSKLLWNDGNPIARDVLIQSMEYFGHDQQWKLLSQRVGLPGHEIFLIEQDTMPGTTNSEVNYIKYNPPQGQSIESCFNGLIVKLNLTFDSMETTNCVLFKLEGQLEYNNNIGILPCVQLPSTTHIPETDDTTASGSSNGEMDEMKSNPVNIGAIVGPVCAAAVIFIVGGVVLFILWRRKFRPSLSKKNKNQRVTMSSLQNGHPHPTEGTVDNVIYAGDDAGIVDNVIYEGGMGADGVFSNPGYADKTPQFKPRMDVPGAFVQPNPGATNKTPQPQRNVIIEEPQYAQIVDDQYADPQKVRDRKDKKNKKKAGKDQNYADLHGPHEKQPGANNSNSNHVYQGLNKGSDYQSLRGPREPHEVRPSQVPKTPQDEHDYTSLTHGDSKASAGTLSKEGPDYTVLEGPDSPGVETATGPDYTTLDGPDSPGDEITSGPDYTVLDGPDSPGD